MGMIYDPTDAKNLVEALTNNVSKSQNIINDLKSASQKLLTHIGPGTKMTGAAVEAGRGLFTDLVFPTITRASEAVEKISKEKDKLNDLIGPAGNELLDEDKLDEQLREKQQQQSNINSMINIYRMQGTLHADDSGLSTMYSDFQRQWTGFLGTVEQDIRDIEDKQEKLHTFNTGANALFRDSLSDLQNSMKAVIILNNTAVNSKTGSYTLPKGINLSDVADYLENDGLTAVGMTAIEEIIQKDLEVNKGTIGRVASESVWKNRYLLENSEGRIIGKIPGATAVAMDEAASARVSQVGKGVTRGFAVFGGIMDGYADYKEDKNIGKAVAHGAVSTLVTLGIAAFIPGVGLGLVASIVAGYVINKAFETDQVKTFFENVEKNIGKSLSNVSTFFGSVSGVFA